MPLTPTDVANKQFNIKMRGYALDEVDAFLDEVEGELARLLRDNHDLRSDDGRPAPVAPQAAPSSASEPVAPPTSMEGQEVALRTLLLAQRTADQAVAEARAESAQIVESARAEAEQTLASARAEAEQTVTTARSEADQLRTSARAEADDALTGARGEADRTLSSAREQAERLEREAASRVQSLTGDLEERRTSLESRIEELRAFEREYRTRLRAYLENQLRDLSGRGGVEDDGGSGVPAAARSAAIGVAPGGGSASGHGAGNEPVGPFGSEPPTVADDGSGR